MFDVKRAVWCTLGGFGLGAAAGLLVQLAIRDPLAIGAVSAIVAAVASHVLMQRYAYL